MAKVVITIEDPTDGSNNVRMTCNPSYKQMAQAIIGNHSDGKSNAFGMALAIGNFIIDRQKKMAMGHKPGKLGIWVPPGTRKS
jgi:hypothetical protein